MLYSTIVDKNEEGLTMVINAAEKFEEGRYLSAIYDCQLKKDEILGVYEYAVQCVAGKPLKITAE